MYAQLCTLFCVIILFVGVKYIRMNLLSMHDMHTVSYGNRRCETETDDIFYESKGSPKLSLTDF